MALNFSPLQSALSSLGIAIRRSQSDRSDLELRDAVIQRFEYTFELSYKFLKRVLEREAANPQSVDQMSYKDLLREAAVKGILTEFEKWVVYRDQRNITSHTYDNKKAESVYNTAVAFYSDAIELCKNLESRSND